MDGTTNGGEADQEARAPLLAAFSFDWSFVYVGNWFGGDDEDDGSESGGGFEAAPLAGATTQVQANASTTIDIVGPTQVLWCSNPYVAVGASFMRDGDWVRRIARVLLVIVPSPSALVLTPLSIVRLSGSRLRRLRCGALPHNVSEPWASRIGGRGVLAARCPQSELL